MKKNVVVLGAGFAGLSCAIALGKRLRCTSEYKILLIDEKDVHIYTPDIYEIATAYNKNLSQECLVGLKDVIAMPYSKILRNSPVEFARDKVISIHPDKKTVELKNGGEINFEYLVIALGSVVNFRNIPGLEEFSWPLKSLPNALAINCHLDSYFHELWQKKSVEDVNIVIGGGGSTGVEFACELPEMLKKICKKFNYPFEQVSITVIEGSGELTGQGKKVTDIILKRHRKLGINVLLDTYIKKVEKDKVFAETKVGGASEIPMNILVWTGGVKNNPLVTETFGDGLVVNKFLQYAKFPNIFAAGDNASITNPVTGKLAPMLAQLAVPQGKLVGNNIAAEILNVKKKSYSVSFKGIIVPLGGKYALYKNGNTVFSGFIAWLMRRFVDLRYALSVLPFGYALRKWIHATNVFIGND